MKLFNIKGNISFGVALAVIAARSQEEALCMLRDACGDYFDYYYEDCAIEDTGLTVNASEPRIIANVDYSE